LSRPSADKLISGPVKAASWTDVDRAAFQAVFDLISREVANEPEHEIHTTISNMNNKPAILKQQGVSVNSKWAVVASRFFELDGTTPVTASDGVGPAHSYCVSKPEDIHVMECLTSSGNRTTIQIDVDNSPNAAKEVAKLTDKNLLFQQANIRKDCRAGNEAACDQQKVMDDALFVRGYCIVGTNIDNAHFVKGPVNGAAICSRAQLDASNK
jgi:hypothetical protein